MRRELAEFICRELLDCSGKLDQSIIAIEDSVSPAFLTDYRRSIGEIMGTFYIDVLRSIFDEYPDLQPDTMR